SSRGSDGSDHRENAIPISALPLKGSELITQGSHERSTLDALACQLAGHRHGATHVAVDCDARSDSLAGMGAALLLVQCAVGGERASGLDAQWRRRAVLHLVRACRRGDEGLLSRGADDTVSRRAAEALAGNLRQPAAGIHGVSARTGLLHG